MRYKCSSCDQLQWRVFFPKETFHWKFAIFHGIAISIIRFPAAAICEKLGFTTDSFGEVAFNLTIAVFLLFLFYGAAMIIESIFVRFYQCRKCGARRLKPDWLADP